MKHSLEEKKNIFLRVQGEPLAILLVSMALA